MARVLQTPAGAIRADSTKDSVEAWDSLGHMSLCLALEEEFGLSFTDQHVTSMTSVGDIVRVLDHLMASGARS